MNTRPMTDIELNSYVVSYPREDGQLPPAKNWQRIGNVEGMELFVGDRTYVIALVTVRPKNMAALRQNTKAAETTAIAYLQREGFIDNEYLYIGLQDIDTTNLPKGLTLDLKKK